MWKSVGFLMSFAVVIEGMTVAAFAILLAGGKQRREQGWGVLAILVAAAAAVQAAGLALMVCLRSLVQTHTPYPSPPTPASGRRLYLLTCVSADKMVYKAYLYDNDERFFIGWFLDKSWVMCTLSCTFQAVCALAIAAAALGLPTEGGYELIPNP